MFHFLFFYFFFPHITLTNLYRVGLVRHFSLDIARLLLPLTTLIDFLNRQADRSVPVHIAFKCVHGRFFFILIKDVCVHVCVCVTKLCTVCVCWHVKLYYCVIPYYLSEFAIKSCVCFLHTVYIYIFSFFFYYSWCDSSPQCLSNWSQIWFFVFISLIPLLLCPSLTSFFFCIYVYNYLFCLVLALCSALLFTFVFL